MPDLWTALNIAATPNPTIHLPSLATAVPLEELLARAERTAAQVVRACPGQNQDGRPRLGLLMANGEPWLRGLFAAFRLGGAAVPLALPTSPSGLDGHVEQLSRVSQAAGLDAVLVDRSVARLAARLAPSLDGVAVLDITEVAPAPSARMIPAVATGPDDMAIIQYTSGSTALPKGVVLTHANVLAGTGTLVAALDYTEHDSVGSWLPLFHDMGLFSILGCLLRGTSAWLWRPSDFVRKPLSWLEAFAAARVTTSPAPNFAYDYLVELAREGLPGRLDLSAWRRALNGAEPVRHHTVEEFLAAFAPHGLPGDAMITCYGLAEATLMVTCAGGSGVPRSLAVDRFAVDAGSPIEIVPPHAASARQVVSVGRAAPAVELRVGGREQRPGVVGEIEVRGPAVTGGYLGFAPSQQPITGDGWLRTGDLGFTDGGELFVVGRTKDMIVVRGQNFYADDIEDLVSRCAGAATLRCAAFQADGDAETMHVVLETPLAGSDQAGSFARRIEKDVAVQLGGAAVRILPVAPRSIPLTTSGKVKRHALRQGLVNTDDPGGRA